jgi:TonB family protein
VNGLTSTFENDSPRAGIAFSVAISTLIHGSLLAYWIFNQPAATLQAEPQLRYVELMPSEARTFVEAPGPAIAEAPSPDAAFSNANRRASTPNPVGSERVWNPGDGAPQIGNPAPFPVNRPGPSAPPAPQTTQSSAAQAGPQSEAAAASAETPIQRFEQPVQRVAGPVNWNAAIQEAGRTAAAGGGSSDMRGGVGGEPGFAESGPISFETQWYEWGDYADHMVRRIRRHWYDNMPEIIKIGMKGVVVIRFTIERNGAITDITTLSSSQIPPFDFAARKAIELSSPLNPLPSDFPGTRERVTVQFYYNIKPERR